MVQKLTDKAVDQGWFLIENKITKNQWKRAENIYTPFKRCIFDVIWPCPAPFGEKIREK